MENLRKQWNDACLSIGIPAISKDTSARILAVLLVHGNNEAFVLNKHFVADVEYIQERFNFKGGEIPDAEMRRMVKQYVDELEEYCKEHKNEVEGCIFSDAKPEWAKKLFKEMYHIKL